MNSKGEGRRRKIRTRRSRISLKLINKSEERGEDGGQERTSAKPRKTS
jgi:hypothetical protein